MNTKKNVPEFKKHKSLLSIKGGNNKANDITSHICQALCEVRLIEEGKLKAQTMDELLDELDETPTMPSDL